MSGDQMPSLPGRNARVCPGGMFKLHKDITGKLCFRVLSRSRYWSQDLGIN